MKLHFKPAKCLSKANLHPTWDSVLDHSGADLDSDLIVYGALTGTKVITGRDYLMNWAARLLRTPEDRLPFLAFYGGEGVGKSMFGYALSILIKTGYIRANQALMTGGESGTYWNTELEDAVLCVFEGIDVVNSPNNKAALEKLLTSDTITIRQMGVCPYKVPNRTHWIQTAQTAEECPDIPDTGVIKIKVQKLKQPVPLRIMTERLEQEAPYFLKSLMGTNLKTITQKA